MATQAEKHHFIAAEELREKYKGHFDQVRSLTKAIEASSRTKITVERKKNNTIQFVITGGRKGVDRALEDVKYEFEKRSSQRAQPVPRADLLFLGEGDHRKLLASHSATQKGGELAQRMRKPCLLTEESLRKYDILIGATELRQFACGECNHPWWTYVPRTKPVSTCRTCQVRYDALDREKEFGIGRFICLPCDHTFYGRCDATEMHRCYKCQKLTGPPYINPRFKPLSKSRRFFTTDPPPRVHEIIHASTPHDSTGSTIATFLTVDLGPYIPVIVEREHRMAEKDYSQAFEDEPIIEPPDIDFRPRSGGDDDDSISDRFSTYSGSVCEEGSELSDFDAESIGEKISRKRTVGSDSSDSEEDSAFDKTSTRGSEPDSGIGTGSNVASGTESSSSKPSLNLSVCEFKPGEFPGVVFSKRKEEVTITKKGGKIEGEGVSLTVPPGAVNDEVTISLQACIGGPFCLPEDLAFISPVYLIQPPCVFHSALTLSIKMFVDLETQEDCDEVVFVTSPTKKVLNEDNEAQWNFRTYGSPRLTIGERNGEIDLKHFCFAALAAIGRKKYSYCICLYKPIVFVQPVSRIIFSVTLHHEVYIEHLTRCIEGNFKNEVFTPISRLIHFSDDSISFELPDVQSQGYELHPDRTSCEILREEVDYAKKNKKRAMKEITLYPPRIELQIIQITQSNKVLQFKIIVAGVKKNCRFNISIPPSPSSPQAASLSSSSESATSVSSESISRSDSSSSSSSIRDNSSSSRDNSSSSRDNSSSSRDNSSGRTGRGSRSSETLLLTQSSSGYSSQGSQDGTTTSTSTTTVVDTTVVDKLDGVVNFSTLYNYLTPMASEWRSLAVNLDLAEKTRKIDADGGDSDNKLIEALLAWQRSAGSENPFTWRTIINALEQPSLCDWACIAEKIRSDH